MSTTAADPVSIQDGDSTGPSRPSGSTAPATETDDRMPHHMRIAAQGKLRTYVGFALKFLQESHNRPLVLHTLPPSPIKAPATAAPPEEATSAPNPPLPDVAPNPQNPQPKALASSTTCIPRLITVVEIIKREFVELVAAAKEEERKGWVLHQYNELGCLEDLDGRGGAAPEVTGLSLIEMLDGKNHLQIKRTPYMRITLSKKLLSDEDTKKSTYQEPLPSKKRSKSAKARERRRRKRTELANTAATQGEEIEPARGDVTMNDADAAAT